MADYPFPLVRYVVPDALHWIYFKLKIQGNIACHHHFPLFKIRNPIRCFRFQKIADASFWILTDFNFDLYKTDRCLLAQSVSLKTSFLEVL